MKITKYHVISSKCAAIVGSKPPSQCGRQLRFSQTLPNRSIQDTAPLQSVLESLVFLVLLLKCVGDTDSDHAGNVITWDDFMVDEKDTTSNVGGRVIVVDQNGNGDSTTVQAAVDMVPQNNTQRVKIFIYPGIYSTKASDKDSNGQEMGTISTATVWVQSDFFCATALTIQECVVYSVAEFWGAIAAHHRDSEDEDTGFSFVNCTIKGSGSVFLGRAWGNYATTIYSNCDMDDVINPLGWSDWGDSSRQGTAMFGEYECSGKGSNRSERVEWSKALSREEAEPFQSRDYIYGDGWLRL
ncbi:Pectinesterase protein [Vigna angularis]|uniref:pectinesterase n=1 Tax=Phaseolus angularis TaxID=3914 RepID=A0A8T0K120_PHAAN|nr:Pectinesterase protein [Vigna angularis]